MFVSLAGFVLFGFFCYREARILVPVFGVPGCRTTKNYQGSTEKAAGLTKDCSKLSVFAMGLGCVMMRSMAFAILSEDEEEF